MGDLSHVKTPPPTLVIVNEVFTTLPDSTSSSKVVGLTSTFASCDILISSICMVVVADGSPPLYLKAKLAFEPAKSSRLMAPEFCQSP